MADLHPLQHEWVLSERQGGVQNSTDWADHMTEICTFSTIEDFWRYFNHLPKPSEVFFDGETRKRVGPKNKNVVEYNLFKKGIEPEWGDPQNATGGSFFIRQSMDINLLNMYWTNLVLALVGETIEDSADNSMNKTGANCICGARVVDKGRNLHTMFRLELWINTRDAEIKERIRTNLMDCLMDGVPSTRKGPPKFDWKDHSA